MVIIIKGKDPTTVYDMARTCLGEAQAWADESHLEFCARKSAAMRFTNRRKLDQQRLTIKGEEIDTSEKLKYLRITLDSRLTWKYHIEDRATKATNTWFQIRRAVGSTWGLKPALTHWAYTSVVRPYIAHGAIGWAPNLNKTAMTKLERVQRLACLSITSAITGTPTTAMEVMVGLPPLGTHLAGVAIMSRSRLVASNRWLGNTNRRRRKIRNYGQTGACDEYSETIKEMGMPQNSQDPTLTEVLYVIIIDDKITCKGNINGKPGGGRRQMLHGRFQ